MTRTPKKLWAFGRNGFTKHYRKYVGMPAGCMRAEKVKLPKAIPDIAIFQEDFSFEWVEILNLVNPTQQLPDCVHVPDVVLLEDLTEWQIKTGYLPVKCNKCKWSGMANLWAHSTHSIEGTAALCKICNGEYENASMD